LYDNDVELVDLFKYFMCDYKLGEKGSTEYDRFRSSCYKFT